MKQRVQKIMSANGFCSRRRAEVFIKNGKVKVNDKVIKLGDQASEDDVIKINDKENIDIVCTLTGHGLKDPTNAINISVRPQKIGPNLDELLEIIN